MKTPTHMLIGWALGRWFRPGDRSIRLAITAGAGLPDLPLILLSGAAMASGWMTEGDALAIRATVDAAYFGSETFICLHHLLHSPVSLVFVVFAWWVARIHFGNSARTLLGLAIGAASHAVVDLATHRNDGVLFLWPLDWRLRATFGFDQWDMAGSGLWVVAAELVIWGIAGIWFGARAIRRGQLSAA